MQFYFVIWYKCHASHHCQNCMPLTRMTFCWHFSLTTIKHFCERRFFACKFPQEKSNTGNFVKTHLGIKWPASQTLPPLRLSHRSLSARARNKHIERFLNLINKFIYNLGFLFFKPGLTLIPACIRNYIHDKVWDEITYPFTNFNRVTIDVWGWISNFTPRKKLRSHGRHAAADKFRRRE